MGKSYKIIIFSLFSLLLFVQIAFAFSSSGSTDQSHYQVNETINFTFTADQNLTSNMTSNITIYLLNSTAPDAEVLNYSTIPAPNATNFTIQVNATVNTSGDYIVKANFTFNNTYYESSSIVKVSKAHSFVITTNKPAYSPGETINFTIKATDVNNIGVSDENVTIKLMYSTNDTVLASKTILTNAAGEYGSTFTAPSMIGSYRLTVNDWVATRIIDISTFDLVAFTGDSNGDIKSKFSQGDTVFVYMDLFDTNKTRYQKEGELVSVQITSPNGTQGDVVSYSYNKTRMNTSFAVADTGIYNIKVTVTSTSKSITLLVNVGKYEITGWLEKNATQTIYFFPNDAVNVQVKVFNVSSGEVIKNTTLGEPFELTLLDSSFVNVTSVNNTTTVDGATGIRTFTFSAPNTTGLYYVKVRLNQSKIDLDMKVINTLATTTPADQSYNFKSVFVGNKQTIRIITTLSNATSQINVTNISVVSLKTSAGSDITSSITFNTSIVDYKGFKAGLVEFSSPPNAGLYFIKTLVNNKFAAETQFLLKFYTACAQLDGYKWFISSNDDANLTVRVSEAQDVGLVDSLSGNSSDSTNTEGGSFSNMYGMYDCYAAYKSTASGSSTAGNNTANIRVAVTKIVNTLNGEDVTTKVANLPSNNTDDNGKVTLRLTKPSGGWDGGTYVVELELRDKNNNTDKGFGAFQVKNLWINIWPQQISGRWKWYFAPTENMTFDVNAYNSTSTWYYYGQSQGTGDNCTVLGLFYQGNGAEWFWPPKSISSDKYTWTCTNSTAPANGRFTLKVNHTTAFDSGYYMVRVKVNTTSGVGDVGDGWFAIKSYNVYVRTTSNNYYDSWYKGALDNVSLDIDVTYANSTRWDCYWQKCPSSDLVTENLNISAKLIKYDQWTGGDYPTSKYIAAFTNNTVGTVTTNSLSTLNDSSALLAVTNVSVNSTRNATYTTTIFTSGNLSSDSTIANVTRTSSGSNASTTISILQNATINSAIIRVTPGTNNTANNTLINVSLNATSALLNLTSNTQTNVSFGSNLNIFLSSCTADAVGNCTVAINVTLNGSGSVQLDFLINYNLAQNTSFGSNSSITITIPKNATINSAFIGINATSGNFTANLTLADYYIAKLSSYANLGGSFFNTTNLSTPFNNISFGSNLTSALSSCTTLGSNKNCTLVFNVTLNGTGTVTLSNLLISYDTTIITQNASLWYINTTSGNGNLTLIPRGGANKDSWETGYYNALITVDGPQGKETGYYWFEIRTFFVNLQPVKPTDFRQTTYTYTSGQNITINMSATNKPSWLAGSSYAVSLANVPVNITNMKLSYWDQTTYQMTPVGVTWSQSAINGTTTVNITPSSTLTAGNWYNLEVTMNDSNNNTQTGWAGFQIKDFTLSARTANWKWAFTNAENISLDVAVCTGDTWWCDFSTNTYSGATVNVSVSKLMKSDSWPYTAVSGWTAASKQLTSSNNGKGNITIVPTANLSGGYYSAELSAQYSDGSGSAITTNVWFRVETFKLSVNTPKWNYRMSENVTLTITPSVAATLSDAYISCGYWPDQTTYSISAGTLSANSTSLSAGSNIIMLSPAGRSWVSGYCYGYISVTSGGETQTSYTSFSMQAFTLYISQTKSTYLKNETVVLKVNSDTDQYFNISNITVDFWNYENGSYVTLRLGQHFASNATGRSFRGNATISLNATDYGNWTFKGWHNGKLTAVDSNNSAISQQAWLYFDIRDVLYAYGWPVNPNTNNYISPNTSSETINMIVYTYKYNTARADWWPFDSKSGINVTITSIEKQSCSTWPCTYANVTGWTGDSATSKSDGTAQLNITRSGGWASGWHYINVRLVENSTGEAATLNRQMGFWVNS